MADQLDRLKSALADRYTIESEIGAGGMATVYLAEDLKHHRKVAVKVLRPELAESLGAERFLREIEVTANLNHPHILPLLDSGRAAEMQGGSGQEVLYYVMPYVEGESLRDRINREGQLPLDDAIQIARDVATALGHAHSQGVIHRDIKPENILLSGGEAVVADFGIARAVSEAGAERLTETGLAVGTPAYMSPEQASGEHKLDGRSDIYALGCVLYEMLAGDAPFTASTPQALIAKKLAEPTPRIRVIREAVPALVEAALTKALVKNPADRFVSAQQFAEALQAPAEARTVAQTEVMPTAGGGWKLGWRWIAALAVVLVVAVLGIMRFPGLAGGDSSAGVDEIDRLVVAPFENRTTDPAAADWGFVAAEFVTRALDRARVVTVVPASVVRDLAREVDPAEGMSLVEIAGRTGASYAVAGSYLLSGGRLRFDVELLKPTSGELLLSLDPVAGPEDSLESVVTLLAEHIAAATAAHFDPGIAYAWSSPPSLEAIRGLLATQDLFCQIRWNDAIDQAHAALEVTPDFAPLLLMVAISHLNLFRPREADSVLNLIEPLREQMTTIERLLADGTRGMLRGDHAETIRNLEQMYRIRPNSYGYHAGWGALRTNRFSDALERLLASEPDDTPCSRSWYAWWIATAETYHMLGRYEEELDIARDGLERFPTVRAFMDYEAIALAGLGRFDAVDSVLDVIAGLPAQPAYNPGQQKALIGIALKAMGHHDEYEDAMDRALAWFAAQSPSEFRFSRGRAFYYAEHWSDADTLFATLSVEAPDNIDYRGYQGVALAHLDRRDEALAIDQWLEQLDRPYLLGANTRWRAAIAAALGDREGAVRLLQQAYQEGMYLGYLHHRDPEWETLQDYRPYLEVMGPEWPARGR